MSRLFRNIGYNIVGQGLVLILGFIGVKFIFSRLGADAFGIIFFSQILTGVLTTALELGVLATTVREVSGHYATDPKYVEQLVRTAAVFYWGIGLALFAALLLAAPLLVERWVNLKSIDPSTAITMLRYLSVTGLIMLPRAMYSSLFQGRQRMELNNSIDVGSSALQQIGIIVVLARGGDAFVAVQWIAISAVLSTLAYMVVTARLFGWRALVPAYFHETVKRNFRFTAHMGALSVLNMALLQFDKIVVSKLQPIASVGYYSFASQVVIRISFAASAIAQAALPSFSSLYHGGKAKELLAQYRKLQDLIGYGMVLPFAATIFGAMPVYTYIFNRQVAWLLLLPTALLCLGFFFYSTVNVPYTFAVALGRPDIASRSYALALIVVIVVTPTLILLYGLAGAASSWVIYQLFLYAYMIPRIYRACLHISPLTWYAHILKVLALAGLTYGAAWLLLVVPHPYSIPVIVATYIGASVIFLGGALLLIGPDLRQTVHQIPRALIVRRATEMP